LAPCVTQAKASSLEVTSYTPWFAAYSMYLSIRNILYSSLAMALGVAFVIMLLSVDVAVALIISIVRERERERERH
jgi:hypothetical protein